MQQINMTGGRRFNMAMVALCLSLLVSELCFGNTVSSDIHLPWPSCKVQLNPAKYEYAEAYPRAQKNVELFCELAAGDKGIDYHTFEEFAYSVYNYTIEVHVRCENTSVAVEFRDYSTIGNLMSEHIERCLVVNVSAGYREFYMENNRTAPWFQVDNRQILKREQCVLKSDLQDIVISLMDFPSVVDCYGPKLRTLSFKESQVSVDISFAMENKTWALLLFQYAREPYLRPIRQKCVYNHLIHLDISDNQNFDDNALTVMMKRNAYPSVKVLNMSRNGLTRIPRTMRNVGWGVFPNLQTADVSYNKIEECSFLDKRANKSDYGHINLRGNKISSLTKQVIENMFSQPKLLVDIRKNYITCECSNTLIDALRALNNHVMMNNRNNTYYGYLWDLECSFDSDVVKANRNITVSLGHLYKLYNEYCWNTDKHDNKTTISSGTIKPELFNIWTGLISSLLLTVFVLDYNIG